MPSHRDVELPSAEPDDGEEQRTGRRKGVRKLKWNPSMFDVLLESLLQSLGDGLRAGGSFKPQAWERATRAVQAITAEGQRPLVDKERVKGYIDNQRTLYKEWKVFSNQSGWDKDERGCPTSDNEVLEAYFEANPKHFRWRYSPLPRAAELAVLFDESAATGDYARTPSELLMGGSSATTSSTQASGSTPAATARRALAIDPLLESETQGTFTPTPMPTGRLTSRRKRAADDSDDNSLTSGSVRRVSAQQRTGHGLDGIKEELARQNDLYEQQVRQQAEALSQVAKATSLLYEKYDYYSEDALAVAARTLENETTARSFLISPDVRQAALLRRYLLDGGITHEEITQAEAVRVQLSTITLSSAEDSDAPLWDESQE